MHGWVVAIPDPQTSEGSLSKAVGSIGQTVIEQVIMLGKDV